MRAAQLGTDRDSTVQCVEDEHRAVLLTQDLQAERDAAYRVGCAHNGARHRTDRVAIQHARREGERAAVEVEVRVVVAQEGEGRVVGGSSF